MPALRILRNLSSPLLNTVPNGVLTASIRSRSVAAMQHAPGVIEAARVAAGISKRQLAQQAGMVPSTLIRKIRGDSPFDVDELGALAKALDMPLHALFGDAA